jgi:hypothetical protein
MTRMLRAPRSAISPAIFALVSSSPETSSTTGFPAKKPGDRESQVSASVIHRETGISGFSTKARNERPQNWKDCAGWVAVAIGSVLVCLMVDKKVIKVNDVLRTGVEIEGNC